MILGPTVLLKDKTPPPFSKKKQPKYVREKHWLNGHGSLFIMTSPWQCQRYDKIFTFSFIFLGED